MPAKRLSLDADELLSRHSPPIVEITNALRELIKCTLPGIVERVYPGWHALGYVHTKAAYIGGIFPRDAHVALVFEWGIALPDPDSMLRGTGKRVRQIVIEDIDAIPAASIVALLHAAVAYGEQKFR